MVVSLLLLVAGLCHASACFVTAKSGETLSLLHT
jgi:hypothetical protein